MKTLCHEKFIIAFVPHFIQRKEKHHSQGILKLGQWSSSAVVYRYVCAENSSMYDVFLNVEKLSMNDWEKVLQPCKHGDCGFAVILWWNNWGLHCKGVFPSLSPSLLLATCCSFLSTADGCAEAMDPAERQSVLLMFLLN